MTFQELIPYLNNNHFYPEKKEVTGEEITSLIFPCATIHQKEVKLPALEKILDGTGYKVIHFPNELSIHVTKAK